MRVTRTVVLIVAIAAASPGCAGGAPAPVPSKTPLEAHPGLASPRPAITAAVPSKACGGYHIHVVNRSTGAVRVFVNGARLATVEAGAEGDWGQWLAQGLPAMPWDVVVQPSEGTVLAGELVVEDRSERKAITVRDPGGATAAITDYTC
jgi:hypothetical protein